MEVAHKEKERERERERTDGGTQETQEDNYIQ